MLFVFDPLAGKSRPSLSSNESHGPTAVAGNFIYHTLQICSETYACFTGTWMQLQAHAKFTRNANPKASETSSRNTMDACAFGGGFFPLMAEKSHCTSLASACVYVTRAYQASAKG